MSDVIREWARLTGWLSENASASSSHLAAPATEQQFVQAEAEMNRYSRGPVSLHPDLRTLWSLNNGTGDPFDWDSPLSDLDSCAVSWLPGGQAIMSVEQAAL